jgi:Icc-related predicted phosphoesterase
MRLLFTSDLHGDEAGYRLFAGTLAGSEFDAGVISGDMQYDDVPGPELVRLLGLTPEDCVPEMDEPYVYPRVNFIGTRHEGLLKRGLSIKAAGLRRILESAGKPVLMVRGNHDIIDWPDSALIRNIGQKACRLLGFTFVGYEYTGFHRTEDEIRRELAQLRGMMDGRCLLVTHSPPFGVLDTVGPPPIHVGSTALGEFVRDTRPMLHLFGHAHESFGAQGRSVNGSYNPAARGMMSIERHDKGFVIWPVG